MVTLVSTTSLRREETVGKVVALYPDVPKDAMFLHCKNCTEKEKRDDLSVFVYVDDDDLSFWISIICETCNLLVTSYRLMKEVE